MNANNKNIGWNFDNTYIKLPEIFLSQNFPTKVKNPKLLILNSNLSKELGLNFEKLDDKETASYLSGNLTPTGSQPFSQAYAGHQFGHFTMLGDGRATMIGEQIKPNNKRVDIQFKGSGKTKYSRNGDGRAALSPMLREYIISEAMYGLNISTTRSLAVVTTGENVMRENPLPGAILTRVAESHIRVGTFQYAAMQNDTKLLSELMHYTINRHFPDIINLENLAIELLKKVIQKQIKLISDWMRVGFIHGVMNTDNMTIAGETIDYGPCAFIDAYDPTTVFSSIDFNGRYSFFNQPMIAHWNLSRFAETLLPLINNDEKKSLKIAEEIINDFSNQYKSHWLKIMRKKIGLNNEENEDEDIIKDLFSIMEKNNYDYTNTFLFLMNNNSVDSNLYKDYLFIEWIKRWEKRKFKNHNKKDSLNLMYQNNPQVIPRNHIIENVLNLASEEYNLKPMNELIEILSDPYNKNFDKKEFQIPSKLGGKKYQTYCGT